jgi:hypothetical protein
MYTFTQTHRSTQIHKDRQTDTHTHTHTRTYTQTQTETLSYSQLLVSPFDLRTVEDVFTFSEDVISLPSPVTSDRPTLSHHRKNPKVLLKIIISILLLDRGYSVRFV